MILANYAQQNRNCVREWGSAFRNPLGQFKPPLFMSFYVPNTAQVGEELSAFPNGYNSEACWQLPLKSGGLSTSQIRGLGTLSAVGDLGKNAEAAMSGSGGIDSADALLVAALIAALTGSGGISAADLKAFLDAVASITGAGGVSSAAASGLGALLASVTGTGSAAATASALGALAASITVTGTGLSTANVAEAVWSALAASNNADGTMGNKLNTASSGGVDLDALAAAVWAATVRSLTGTVDANVKQVNDVAITGTGAPPDHWRPA